MKIKNLTLLFLFLAALAGKAFAQQQSEAANIEKMNPLMAWVGRWQGEGSMQMPSGETRKSTVDERIESKLGGVVLLIEGVGKSTDQSTNKDAVVHHALAVLSYDQFTNQYKMKSYLKDGKSTDAWFNVVSDNNYQWGFDTKAGKIRYTINLNPTAKTWNEVGEFSQDGNTWRKFFEMNLTKTN